MALNNQQVAAHGSFIHSFIRPEMTFLMCLEKWQKCNPSSMTTQNGLINVDKTLSISKTNINVDFK